MPTLTDPPRRTTPLGGSAAALSERSDEQLVALLRGGREEAFDALAERYQARLLRFCWKMLRSKEDAEDAVQDVFAAAYRALLADERQIQLRPWLYRIAQNRCINELRRSRRLRSDPLGDLHAELAPALVDRLAVRQRFGEVIGDVQALPDTQRTALLLRELDGFAYQEIATAMNTTVPGVKSLLVRARFGLRDLACSRDLTQGATTAPPARGRGTRRSARAVSYQTAYAAASAER
jgi:RNA polymerase sigma factor (sigma-70 family)